GELIATDMSKNLISIFYLNEALKKDAGVEKSKHEPMEIKSVGLLGAGLMGGGIAQLVAYHDLPVRMKDINQNAVNVGLQKAEQLFNKAVSRKKISRRDMKRKFTLISGTTDYSGFSKCDLIIEAVVENMEIKQQVFTEIETNTGEETILASNTSSLSITEIASAVKKPERVIGFHFFNPVHRMPLVEIIRGEKTSDAATVSAVAFAKKLGKIPIVVKNSPGFLVNRILGPYLNEAALLLEEGAKIEEIDKAMVDFGMPMGPLHLMDEVGIDVGFKVAQILSAAFGDRVTPSRVIEKLYDDERLGRKGGRGFYTYGDKGKKADSGVYALIADLIKSEAPVSQQAIQERLTLIMIKEGVLCLEEEIVRRPRDVDAGMIFGTGFPPFRGGLIRYADAIGASSLSEKMAALVKKRGERFHVPELLKRMAEQNETFY
ncbi:MAG: 3-hydroxyacyl-CoA dehydrogenase NAD-binding domain-containing protein, partial [bacterium]